MTISKSGLLAEYVEVKAQYDRAKKRETELRKKIVDVFFPTGGEGTHSTTFNNLEVKAGIKFNYKFDQKELEAYEELFSDAEKACVKRRPSLDLTKYRALDEIDRNAIDDCVIITPGLPTLSIKETE